MSYALQKATNISDRFLPRSYIKPVAFT